MDENRRHTELDGPDQVTEQSGESASSDNLPADDETESGNQHSGARRVDPEQFSRQLLDEIKQNDLIVFGKDTPLEIRNAGDIPGLQFDKIWLLALPPKTDGKYDSTVLQDTAFRKIKACLAKNTDEKVIAVYNGKIGDRKLTGANKVAADYKITLTNFSDINKVLGMANTTETENSCQLNGG